MITLTKNFTDENKTQKRINIKKIISLKEVINKPMEEIKIKVNNIDELLEGCYLSNTIFHTPFQAVPDGIRRINLKSVIVTVHDMIPNILPDFFPEKTVQHFNDLLNQLNSDDHVICVSEATRIDFLRFKSLVREDNVHVTPLAPSDNLKPILDLELIRIYRLAIMTEQKT